MLSAGLLWTVAALVVIAWGATQGLKLRSRQRELDAMQIRPLASHDIELATGFAGRESGQLQALLVAQQAGSVTCVVAWLGRQPLGMASIDWNGPRDEKAREFYPECPEIHSIEVEASRRSAGIGSDLLAHCEGLVRSRGHACVGLAVTIDNVHAYALYLRSGYADTRRIEYETPAPTRSGSPGPPLRCRFLVKHFNPGPSAKDHA